METELIQEMHSHSKPMEFLEKKCSNNKFKEIKVKSSNGWNEENPTVSRRGNLGLPLVYTSRTNA